MLRFIFFVPLQHNLTNFQIATYMRQINNLSFLFLVVAAFFCTCLLYSCGTTWAPTSFALNWRIRYVDKNGHNLLDSLEFEDSAITTVPDSAVKVMIWNEHKESNTEEDWVPISQKSGSVMYLPIEKTLAISYGENYVSQKLGDTQQYEYIFTVRIPYFMKRDGEADTIRSVWTFDGYTAKPQSITRNGQSVTLQEIHENNITIVLDYPQPSTSTTE